MTFRFGKFTAIALAAVWAGTTGAWAQTPPKDPAKQDPKKEDSKTQTPPKPPKPGTPKPYKDVVTEEAKTQNGVFKVHRIDEKILWEIPESYFGRELLWQVEIGGTSTSTGMFGPYNGAGVLTRVVRFERRNNSIYMRGVDFSNRAQNGLEPAVKLGNLEPILQSFAVEAEGDMGDKKKSVVIDVSRMFTSDPQELSVKSLFRAGGVDGSKSYVDKVTAFPENIETRSYLTFAGPGGPVAAIVQYSLILLPEKPMMGRYRDTRVGFFATPFSIYGRPEERVVEKQFISRFRLEKSDPSEAISVPKKPIVFYLSREVPDKWRKYIKMGIEDWQPAFEAAGFKNAILAKDAPTPEEDPNWDPEDIRYNVIRWVASPVENAMGPSVQDPRSGETLSAHLIIWHNVLQLAQSWYFSQAAAVDKRAQRLPLPDDLLGYLMRYVVEHEVGHTLGLEHNFKGSAFYTPAQLRDRKFIEQNGLSGSIMDYARFNYVAQPGDDVPMIGKLGPYDRFAIEWGYKPIPYANSPEAEIPELDRIAARQVTNPATRFGNYLYPQDPTTQSEDISSDAVEAGRLGFANIRRIAKLLVPATSNFGDDYSFLKQMHGELMSQRMTELLHVARLVGGVVETDYHAGRGNAVFKPVDAAKQRSAIQFLLNEGLRVQPELVSPDILARIQPDGVISMTTSSANLVLNQLLGDGRVRRMFDIEAQQGASAYTVGQLVSDITSGVWSELGTTHPRVDIYRRNIQRTYLDTMAAKSNVNNDLKLYVKDNLRALAKRIDAALPKTTDRLTAMHLKDSRSEIEKILLGKRAAAAPSSFDFASMFGLKDRDLCHVDGPHLKPWEIEK